MNTFPLRPLILCAVLATSLTSCLDENPRDRIDEQQAYDNATSLYVNTVATLYNYIGGSSDSQGLQGTYRGVYDYNTFTTDEAMIPTRGGDWYDGGFWQNLYLHRWTATDPSLADTWNYLYKVIVTCNQSLEAIEAHAHLLTDDQRQRYEAEVRAVRAIYYWYLMDMYGRVPLITTTRVNAAKVVQSERPEVCRFAFDELQAALPLLSPERSNTEGNYYGRVTQGVACFILAKLALNAEVYTDADWTDGQRPDGRDIYFTVDGQRLNAWQTTLHYCNRLTAMGYRLSDDYAANFAVHNETSEENIFTIPMDKTLYANQFQYLFRSRHYAHGGALGCAAENGSCATLSTMKAYGYGTDDADKRLELNFFTGPVVIDGQAVKVDGEEPLVYQPLAVKLDLTGDPYEKVGGARMKKYETDRTAHADGKLQDNDIVLYRYADALLMAAEAKVRNGESGQEELDAVRRRAGMPSRPATLDNILTERLLELVWEGWRRQDLVRFGRFTTAYDQRPQLTGEANGYTTVFPIPNNALMLNQNLRQNPGY